jgi:long-chain acyl-CoA synthetase
MTGDIGFMDEDGYLTIVDRKKDIIVASGYNVYPQEIDEILMSHPKVLEACTIGVQDPYRGEAPKSFVALKPGEVLDKDELIAFLKERLAAYKCQETSSSCRSCQDRAGQGPAQEALEIETRDAPCI